MRQHERLSVECEVFLTKNLSEAMFERSEFGETAKRVLENPHLELGAIAAICLHLIYV